MESQKLKGKKKSFVENFVCYVQFWSLYELLLALLPAHASLLLIYKINRYHQH